MVSNRQAIRLRRSHRSTISFVVGAGLLAAGLGLTAAHLTGLVFPTVLAVLGIAVMLCGVASYAQLIAENFRVRQDQPYYDPDDEELRPRRRGPERLTAPRRPMHSDANVASPGAPAPVTRKRGWA